MSVEDFMMPLLGGALIGLASAVMLVLNGRIAGISGILGGLLGARSSEVGWRSAFLVGLILAGTASMLVAPEAFPAELPRSPWALGVAGLLVGFGTRMGGGCTSGHGVCGNGRMSARSIVATLTFIATGMLTVGIIRHAFGGFV